MEPGHSQSAPAKTAPIPIIEPEGVVARTKDAASRFVRDYSGQSKYYKWKTWIVGSYAVIAVVSLVVALWPANMIHAFARVTRSEMDNGSLIYVRNDSQKLWTRVRVTVNDQWELTQDRLAPGDNIDVSVTSFHRHGTGDTAPIDLVPQSIRVHTDQGSYSEDIER